MLNREEKITKKKKTEVITTGKTERYIIKSIEIHKIKITKDNTIQENTQQDDIQQPDTTE